MPVSWAIANVNKRLTAVLRVGASGRVVELNELSWKLAPIFTKGRLNWIQIIAISFQEILWDKANVLTWTFVKPCPYLGQWWSVFFLTKLRSVTLIICYVKVSSRNAGFRRFPVGFFPQEISWNLDIKHWRSQTLHATIWELIRAYFWQKFMYNSKTRLKRSKPE